MGYTILAWIASLVGALAISYAGFLLIDTIL